jgi:hypothetical protein
MQRNTVEELFNSFFSVKQMSLVFYIFYYRAAGPGFVLIRLKSIYLLNSTAASKLNIKNIRIDFYIIATITSLKCQSKEKKAGG